MEKEPVSSTEDILIEQEESCRKGLKTLAKALMMRLFVLVLLAFILFSRQMELWIMGLMVFATVITLAGALPLISEWRKQYRKLQDILEQYE